MTMSVHSRPYPIKLSPATIEEVFLAYGDDIQAVENQIKKSLSSRIELVNSVSSYILDSGGKRLRPLLLMIISRLLGYQGTDNVILAGVVEFIHTATLLHDDVIDEAALRRGKKAARMVWGNQASILVGDYLFSRSFVDTVALNRHDINALLSKTCQVLSEGEILQLVYTSDFSMTEQNYLSIIEAKTSSLISLACRMGGLIAGASQIELEALLRFGSNLGIAYQMADDTLDYTADKGLLGKTLGQDFKEGKITLPLLHLMAHCSAEEKKRVEVMFHQERLEENALIYVQRLLNEYHSIEYAMVQAESYSGKARQELAVFPSSRHKDALYVVSDYVITRNR